MPDQYKYEPSAVVETRLRNANATGKTDCRGGMDLQATRSRSFFSSLAGPYYTTQFHSPGRPHLLHLRRLSGHSLFHRSRSYAAAGCDVLMDQWIHAVSQGQVLLPRP